VRTRTAILALAVVVAATRPASAQVERYELGQRLKRFEADWEKTDEAGRKRALKVLQPLTRQYLTFQFAEAGRTLDEARFALRAEKPTDAERWLASLAVVPEKRLVDSKAGKVKVEVRAFYTMPGDAPSGVAMALHIGLGQWEVVSTEKLPATATVLLSHPPDWSGDQLLWFETAINGRELEPRTLRLSAVPFGEKSLDKPKSPDEQFAHVGDLSNFRAGIEAATLQTRFEVLQGMKKGDVPETDVLITRWYLESALISIFGMVGSRFYAAPLPLEVADRINKGQYELTVPTAGGKRTPCRVLMPKKFTGPTPVVVALHGMGGSENLFFEGYGAGCVVKACEKRGWMLVCPRGGNGFLGGPPPVTEIIDKLAERYPIDKSRVFLMGHSMGAAQTVDLAQQKPGAFAAIAALGGGGRVRKPEAFNGVPTFIGVGSEDFAKGGAEALHKALADAGVKTATLKEYPDVEHTVIVRVAVDDVFAEFDRASSSSPQRGGR
jgi:predicted esterase